MAYPTTLPYSRLFSSLSYGSLGMFDPDLIEEEAAAIDRTRAPLCPRLSPPTAFSFFCDLTILIFKTEFFFCQRSFFLLLRLAFLVLIIQRERQDES